MMMPSQNPYSGKMRNLCPDGKRPLDVQKVENVIATTIYCSKWMNRIDVGEDWFFTTPSNINPDKGCCLTICPDVKCGFVPAPTDALVSASYTYGETPKYIQREGTDRCS